MELNHTCLELLTELYNHTDQFLSVRELAAKTGRTERSVRYALVTIQLFMQHHGYECFEREYGKGVCIKDNRDARQFADQFLHQPTPYQYKYSGEERQSFLLAHLLCHNRYSPVGSLASRLTVSDNTVIKDLEALDGQLAASRLSLVKKPRLGIRVAGEESAVRREYLNLIARRIPLAEQSNYIQKRKMTGKINQLILDDLFHKADIGFLQRTIRQSEALLNKVFSDESYYNLLVYLALTLQRNTGQQAGGLPSDATLTGTLEYAAACEMLEQLEAAVKTGLGEGERFQLAIQLLSARVMESGELTDSDDAEKLQIRAVAEKMTDIIERLYRIDFGRHRRELIDRLGTHLLPTVYRTRYQKKIDNPIYEEIAVKHPQLLENTRIAAEPLRQYCASEIDDQELSYLALYFLVAINQSNPRPHRRPRVLVACGSGYSTAQVVASQINDLFEVDIVAVASGRVILDLIEEGTIGYDYLISTIPLTPLPAEEYIKVNPIFAEADYEKIRRYLEAKQPHRNIKQRQAAVVDRLVQVAKRFGVEAEPVQLKYEFLSVLIEANQESDYLAVNTQKPNLADITPSHLIRLGVSCSDWKEVVREGMLLLEQHGYTTPDYKEAVIRNIVEYGPEMVMFPGVLISHATAESGCKKLGFGYMRLNNPVRFGHPVHDPVRVVVSLSVVDRESHMDALMQLFRLLSDKSAREEFIRAKSKEEVRRMFLKFSK